MNLKRTVFEFEGVTYKVVDFDVEKVKYEVLE